MSQPAQDGAHDPFRIKRRGLMLVLSSPSGAGKSTISRQILDSDGEIDMSISVTTRPRRPGEVDGTDYHFVDATEFNLMVNRGELLEHAKVFGNYYGTPKAPVMEALARGRDVLFDIDWQGTQQLAEHASDDLVRVFILPPSTAELERRLKTRAQDPADVVAQRMAKAADEMSHYYEYDWVIVNRSLPDSLGQVRAILTSERLRRRRQTGLSDFVKGLREGR
ncbi:guanylate kinase [Marivibrio sp.]|uniref:guanylate kinase n=1 Tax=Marivibrio sp. TaxID=2039719 RepID=UPI0032EF06F8